MTSPVFPTWLAGVSIISLTVALACAAIIAADETRRPQRMWIMNLVWPLTALFGGLIWLAGYLVWGREGAAERDPPMAVSIAKAGTHCGAGCTLGDLIAETLALAFPGLAVVFGAGWLFKDRMFAIWALDFVLAFGLGVGFQYFSIMPRPGLTTDQRLLLALRADAASIAAWQVGMYGGMAVLQFWWFKPSYGAPATANTPEFWFAMQLAMLCGFVTSYPVNWLLVKTGIKERM